MTKQILGSYNTIEETRDAIAVFELQGHESKNIVVFANHIDDDVFQHHQTVNFETKAQSDDEGFIEKIKDKLHIRDNLNFNSREALIEYGLSENNATMALAEVQVGKIIVIVDNELRMGHA